MLANEKYRIKLQTQKCESMHLNVYRTYLFQPVIIYGNRLCDTLLTNRAFLWIYNIFIFACFNCVRNESFSRYCFWCVFTVLFAAFCILQRSAFCNVLHSATFCILQRSAFCNVLHSATFCILQRSAFCSVLHSAAFYIGC